MDESLVKIRHGRSLKDFPHLKLEKDEYVEFAFTRAKICLLMIIGGIVLGFVAIIAVFLLVTMSELMLDKMGEHFLFIILGALFAAVCIMGMVSIRIYRGNKLFITNKHIMQFVMNSLVSTSINIIDIDSVEDVSFRQDNIFQKIFHYGTFRLSTIGDETTYTFNYSDILPSELRAVTNMVTAAKQKNKKSSQRVEKDN